MTPEFRCESCLATVKHIDPSGICKNCGGDCSRHTLKTIRHRISRIALNSNSYPALPSADDTVDPVTGENIDFPFVTTQMKEDEGYFDSDEHDLNDSDLGEDDSVSTNAEEAYYASNGKTSLADDGDDHNDFDPAACELTIDSFSEIEPLR